MGKKEIREVFVGSKKLKANWGFGTVIMRDRRGRFLLEAQRQGRFT